MGVVVLKVVKQTGFKILDRTEISMLKKARGKTLNHSSSTRRISRRAANLFGTNCMPR
jgi:hypothetical protein